MSILAKTMGYTAAAVVGICMSSIIVAGAILIYQVVRAI